MKSNDSIVISELFFYCKHVGASMLVTDIGDQHPQNDCKTPTSLSPAIYKIEITPMILVLRFELHTINSSFQRKKAVMFKSYASLIV